MKIYWPVVAASCSAPATRNCHYRDADVRRITEISETGGEPAKAWCEAELDVKRTSGFPLSFQGDPVMPGCLGLDALWQMVGFFLGWLGSPASRALGHGAVKFSGQVLDVKKENRLRRPISSA